MRSILLVNSKGGCGKTTLAVNLAVHYARQDKRVALVDFDPQASSLKWLEARPKDKPVIRGLDGTQHGTRLPRDADVVILDAPAGVAGADLTALIRRAQTVVIPVMPSATDIRAAARFIHALLLTGRVQRKEIRLATVANRVPINNVLQSQMEKTAGLLGADYATANTRIYRPLERFLDRLRIPFVASLPDSQAYALADAQGLGIFEMSYGHADRDRAQWQPLLDWLASPRSLPRAS
jgi:chromosome partitioning protein